MTITTEQNETSSMAWDYPAPFTQTIKVTPDHIDGLNHTNNAIYIQWCEKTAWAHSESLGLSLADYQRLNRAMAIVEANYSYLSPSYAGDELVIGTWLAGSDKKRSLQRLFQICNCSNGQTILKGKWTFICINIESGRPAKMPAEFIDSYIPNRITIR